MAGVAVPLHGAGGHPRRRARGQPRACRPAGRGRLFRQHPGAAQPHRRAHAPGRRAAAGPRGGAGRAGPPRAAVRATGGGAAAAAQPGAQPLVPGAVQSSGGGLARAAAGAGLDGGRPAAGGRRCAVRADRGSARALRWQPGHQPGLCPRAVRAGQHAAPGRPLCGHAGRTGAPAPMCRGRGAAAGSRRTPATGGLELQ